MILKMVMLQVSQEVTRTRRGRTVRKPARYCLAVEGPASQGEGRCKGTDHEMDHETEKERVHMSSHEANDHGRTELI